MEMVESLISSISSVPVTVQVEPVEKMKADSREAFSAQYQSLKEENEALSQIQKECAAKRFVGPVISTGSICSSTQRRGADGIVGVLISPPALWGADAGTEEPTLETLTLA
ncbi:hypothetical protein D4764_14G0001030 [Takifugu flavidus]|uniref:Uncharacterized protein n=1 Tax=Takifugu flavidus TaxID=433684 RepID=A0A5C6P2S9_9TELE|nr:hypothetical protein D4764_14G0001030 [Takifugu flavidus]